MTFSVASCDTELWLGSMGVCWTSGLEGFRQIGRFLILPTRQLMMTLSMSSLSYDNVNSLPAMDAHERPLFNELLWGLVTLLIFVRC